MGPVSKQDVQNLITTAQNRIFERIAGKQDVQLLTDTVKTLLNQHQQSMQLQRQAEVQRLQLLRRMTALEARNAQLEQEIRGYRDALNRISVAQTQPQQIRISSTAPQTQHDPISQYVYRPA